MRSDDTGAPADEVAEEVARDVPHPESGTDPSSVADDAATGAAERAAAGSDGGAEVRHGSDPVADPAAADPAPDPAPDVESVAAADPRSRGELLGDLILAEEKRDEYLDDLRRSHADFENYRRRVMRDGAIQREAGKADVISSLLEVLDDLDRTRDAAEKSPEADLTKGVELVANKLRSTLEGVGVQRVDEVGVPFDPNIHEAVQQRDADGELDQPVVAEVLRAGYRLGDRVLRPTMVVVEQ